MGIGRFDLNLLRNLDALLKERNVTNAAHLLELSQPAMSNSLRRLRELFDDPLLIRTSEGMTPTERALALQPIVREVLATVEQAVQPQTNFDPATSDKTYTLGMNDYGATILLPPLLRHLTRLAPKIRLRTRHYAHGSQYDDLSSGAIDLSITIEDTRPH